MLLLAALSSPGPRPGTAAQGPVPSPTHYDLSIALDVPAERLEGTARISLANASSEPVTEVPFLLYRRMRVAGAENERGDRLAVRQDLVPFEDFPALVVTRAVVTLPAPLAAGAGTTITLRWEGTLQGYAETGMAYIQDRIGPDFTILRDDAWAYPRPGSPSLASLRGAPPPVFSYRAAITVPADLVVANGGRLLGVDSTAGRATYVYESLRPSWRMDFAIARYGLLHAGPIRIYYFEGEEAGAGRVARAASDALALLGRWFGPLGASDGLAFIEIPDGWGSQRDETAIIQTAAAFRDSTRLPEVYHEVSHLWNVPDLDRPSPRLQEGLATYLSYRIEGAVTGTAALDSMANRVLTRLRRELPDHPRWREVPPVRYGAEGLTDLSYRVGALFFYLLERLEGPGNFDRAWREYFQSHREAGGTTREFVEVARAASRVDPGRLFEEWLFSTGWAAQVEAREDINALLDHYRE